MRYPKIDSKQKKIYVIMPRLCHKIDHIYIYVIVHNIYDKIEQDYIVFVAKVIDVMCPNFSLNPLLDDRACPKATKQGQRASSPKDRSCVGWVPMKSPQILVEISPTWNLI